MVEQRNECGSLSIERLSMDASSFYGMPCTSARVTMRMLLTADYSRSHEQVSSEIATIMKGTKALNDNNDDSDKTWQTKKKRISHQTKMDEIFHERF